MFGKLLENTNSRNYKLRMRRFFRARKNSYSTCHHEVKCRKALWLQARKALWSISKRTQSSASRFSCVRKMNCCFARCAADNKKATPRSGKSQVGVPRIALRKWTVTILCMSRRTHPFVDLRGQGAVRGTRFVSQWEQKLTVRLHDVHLRQLCNPQKTNLQAMFTVYYNPVPGFSKLD